jgi:DNA adenine methylase
LTEPKPFIKWVGGKRKLVPEIVARMPKSFGAYHEPFMGGAALFWHLRPTIAHLSDANKRLVRTYRGVRDSVGSVIDLLDGYPNTSEFFYAHRAIDVDALSDVGAAAWFIYLNKTCFNGLYRVNKKGGFNSPFGSYANPTICDSYNLAACSAALKGVEIHHGSYLDVETRAEGGDFVYLDPPYVPVSDSANFTSYTADGFGHADQVALSDLARRLRARGVHVILSNADVPIVRELYAGFKVDTIMAARAINSNGAKRGKIAEVLIY